MHTIKLSKRRIIVSPLSYSSRSEVTVFLNTPRCSKEQHLTTDEAAKNVKLQCSSPRKLSAGWANIKSTNLRYWKQLFANINTDQIGRVVQRC
jgi:hypothetical protein